MRKLMKRIVLAILLLAPLGALAQVSQPPIVQTASVPTVCFNFFYALTTTTPWTIYGPTASDACQVVGSGGGGFNHLLRRWPPSHTAGGYLHRALL